MTLEQIRERIVELQDEMQAIVNLAETEERELSNDENTTVDDCLVEINDELRVRETRMEKVEAEKQRIALARTPAVDVQAAISMPAIPKSHRKLKAFDSEEDAYRAGLWFKAAFLNDKEASRFSRGISSSNGAIGFYNRRAQPCRRCSSTLQGGRHVFGRFEHPKSDRRADS